MQDASSYLDEELESLEGFNDEDESECAESQYVDYDDASIRSSSPENSSAWSEVPEGITLQEWLAMHGQEYDSEDDNDSRPSSFFEASDDISDEEH